MSLAEASGKGLRAGVLSKDEISEFLNEHFINTWVPHSELGRVRRLRETDCQKTRARRQAV